ncbi:MAG: hypothetical protein J7K32_08005 [Deltaproteobacteria bacterium]|nr:hypothetical protein [Deltaproteobacteria bacterium]
MSAEISSKTRLPDKKAVFDEKETSTKIIQRDLLRSGNIIKGAAILTEYSSTFHTSQCFRPGR